MKKSILTKVVAVITIVCTLITIASVFVNFVLPLYLSYKFNRDIKNAGSIGIIGGTDGPTTIFITSDPGLSIPVTVIFAALAFLGFAYLVAVRCRRLRH